MLTAGQEGLRAWSLSVVSSHEADFPEAFLHLSATSGLSWILMSQSNLFPVLAFPYST